MEITQEEEQRYSELQLLALNFSREGNTDELEKMLSYGMNINLSTMKNDSLLMLASYNGNIETTKMLIEKGANLNQTNQRGQTPLEGVCFKGNLPMVKLLVESGANFEGKAIIYASMFGNMEIVKYLKKQGINQKTYKIFGIDIDFITSLTSKVRRFLKA